MGLASQWSSRLRWALLVLAYTAYIGAFPFLYPIIGDPLGAAAFIPVVLAGWLFGRKGGALAALSIIPLGVITYGIQEGDLTVNLLSPIQLWVLGSALTVGLLAGTLRDQAQALHQSRAHAREVEQRFQIVTQATGDIIWALELSQGTAWANEAFNTFVTGTGASPADVDAAFWGAVHPEDRPRVRGGLDEAVHGGASEYADEFRMRRHDGRVREMETLGVILRDQAGQPKRVIGATRDVTDRKAAERARQEAVRKEAEIQRLREVSTFKSQLLNTASHELNTPISALKLQVHLAKRALADGDVDRAARAFEVVERNGERLSALIGDTLDVARIQSGRLEITPQAVDIQDLLDEIGEMYTPVADRKDIELRWEAVGETRAQADPNRIIQVLSNLVSNAIKFTPEGGQVSLRSRGENGALALEIADDGIGMDPGQVERLFQPFSQVHDPEQVQEPGTGLGLFISRAIVEEHGGELCCAESVPGQGSTFQVTLPRAQG